MYPEPYVGKEKLNEIKKNKKKQKKGIHWEIQGALSRAKTI